MRISGGRSESDGGVLAAATDGDVAARWSALEACRDYLRLVIRRGPCWRQGDRPSASDLVQQTIVDAWTNFPRFRGETPGQLRAWLGAILIHASLNARRRRRAAPLGSGDGADAVLDDTTSPSQVAQRNAAHEALDAALRTLTDRHREVVRLRIWDQLSFAEIGATLELSEDASRMLFGRALAKLREAMGPGHVPG